MAGRPRAGLLVREEAGHGDGVGAVGQVGAHGGDGAAVHAVEVRLDLLDSVAVSRVGVWA